jgi:hypothetical protein
MEPQFARKQTNNEKKNDNSFCLKINLKDRAEKIYKTCRFIYTINVFVDTIILTKPGPLVF